MKKTVMVILILWSISLNAATDVSGTIGTNTTWTTAGDGIYRIVGDVSIAEGVTLTINPGVIVHYADPVRIQVLGTLNAIGTVTDSIIFEHESAGLTHRGIDFDDGDGTLSYCRIQDGWADDDTSYGGQPYSNRGGAVLVRSIDTPNNNVVIEHCLLTNNYAQEGGGFFAIGYNAVVVVRNCVITNNTATLYGGGISAHHQGPSLTVQNCVIAGNSTNSSYNAQGGGMLILANTSVQLINNVFYGNSTGSYASIGGGGLMYNTELGATPVTVSNCIFWNNTATGTANEIGIYDPTSISALTVDYCDVEGGFIGGTGNINSDPLFVDATNGDFHLSQGSACIDAGNSTGAYATDADDNPTNQDGDNNGTPGYDMGPYEFLQDVQSSFSSGVPSDYIVDTFEGGSSNTIASITLNGIVTLGGNFAVDCYTKSFPLNAPTGSKSIHRWYRITKAGHFTASEGMDLRLYYSDDEFNLSGLLTENNVTLWKNENGSWTNKGGIVSVAGNYVTLSGLPTESDLTGDWAFADMNDSPLPVELVSFKADFDQDKIDISWKTESELNNLGFEVWKKSENQVSYSLLSSYLDNQSLVGLGSSSSGREYELIDTDFEPGNTYSYILYSVDINGTKHKFGPILVNVTDGNIAGTFEVSENYPNPFNPSTTFQLRLNSPSNITLEVYNILGEKVDEVFSSNTQPGTLNITWRAKDLAGGIYYYRILAEENISNASTRVLLKSGKMVLVK